MCDNHTKINEISNNQSVLAIDSLVQSQDSINEKNDSVRVTPVGSPRVWPWTRVVVWFVSLYQRAAAGRPSPCRFTPSCSTYASEALIGHGLFRGSVLAVWRIMRCNPWGGEGFDPVPQPRSWPRRRGSGSLCPHELNNHLKEH